MLSLIQENIIDKENITITCYDFIRNLTKSKVCYNFSEMSAFDAVCKIFNDLKIPYSEDGIFDGKNGRFTIQNWAKIFFPDQL